MSAARASAGRHGPDVRSDCRVTVEAPTDISPKITVQSRVATLYGASIRRLIQTTLALLDASDLSLMLEDSGALPYVLQARIEAAVHRLRPELARSVLPAINDAGRTHSRPQMRRSRLYLPGNQPKFFINAGLHRPDAVILDLEDSVPLDDKDAARLLVRNALRAVDFYGAERMVRVNALPVGLDEIRMLAVHGVQTFLVPKVEDAATMHAASDLLDQLDQPDVELIPIVESARGVLSAYAIASASQRVTALAIGLEDFTADIGAQRTVAGRESLWAQSQIVGAARAAGIQPLASVYSLVDDQLGFQAWLADARALGFDGAGCLHPHQIRAVHAAWAPPEAQVVQAQRIVAAFEAAIADGVGVVALDGRMVDAPVVEKARQLLRLAGIAQ